MVIVAQNNILLRFNMQQQLVGATLCSFSSYLWSLCKEICLTCTLRQTWRRKFSMQSKETEETTWKNNEQSEVSCWTRLVCTFSFCVIWLIEEKYAIFWLYYVCCCFSPQVNLHFMNYIRLVAEPYTTIWYISDLSFCDTALNMIVGYTVKFERSFRSSICSVNAVWHNDIFGFENS